MDLPIKKSIMDVWIHLPNNKESVMELMDQICKTAELEDGTIRTQSAEEGQEKRKRETALTDQELSLKESVTELMDQTCKTAEFPDGTIRTQSAEESQVKRKRETALIDQELSLRVMNHLASQVAMLVWTQTIHAKQSKRLLLCKHMIQLISHLAFQIATQ